MKTIGLLGGMTWESTIPYYRVLNQVVQSRLGGSHSARIILNSVDFEELDKLQLQGRWDECGAMLASAAQTVERAGADFIVVCSNTMHKVVPQLETTLRVPVLHIADATLDAVRERGLRTVGLLGTKFTMEGDFIRGRLEKHGLRVIVPNTADRDEVHRVIYEEFCQSRFEETSRQRYREVMRRLVDSGAEGIILGCTEIGLLVNETDSPVPVFDTAVIHARAAGEYALDGAPASAGKAPAKAGAPFTPVS